MSSLSSRKLAAELAISPMTLYNYYKDINALLREVLLFGLSRFSADQYELLRAGLKRRRARSVTSYTYRKVLILSRRRIRTSMPSLSIPTSGHSCPTKRYSRDTRRDSTW
ncbi:MAG: TetR/AcrR family transcriptional regulator [Candidatus Moduliflexus flocculans]|nr:TetR/AcrR family transcriptional regulator [Candidatus Moduliflexus flocculans]